MMSLSLLSRLSLSACLAYYMALQHVLERNYRADFAFVPSDVPIAYHDDAKGQLSHYLLNTSTFETGGIQAAVISGSSTDYWRRVYFRGNDSVCSNSSTDGTLAPEVIPMFANGYAAGPLLDCSPNDIAGCSQQEKLLQTSTMQSLRSGHGFQFFLPTQLPNGKHNAIVLDRIRMSSATGVVFLKEPNYMVVASFETWNLHLYKFDVATKRATLLATHKSNGLIDLVDYDAATSRIVVSHLVTAKQEVFHVNVTAKSFTLVKDVTSFSGQVQFCHEATFYPELASQVIVVSSNKLIQKDSLKIRFFDYLHDRVLADFFTNSTTETDGFAAKGIRVIDSHHILVSFSNYKVKKSEPACSKVFQVPQERAQGKVVLLRLHFSLEDIMNQRAPSVKQASLDDRNFTVVSSLDTGVSALDGVAYDASHKLALVVDQMNDCVLVFRMDIGSREPLRLIDKLDGYIMPHGIAISPKSDLMAVTCYGDNSVYVQRLPDYSSPLRLRSGWKWL